MNFIVHLPFPKIWRPFAVGLSMFVILCTAVLWNWQVLLEREERDVQSRFTLDVEAIGQRIQDRMRAYETVLRGVSAAFTGEEADVSHAQWDEVMDRFQIQDLYPSLSSLAWSRNLRHDQLEAFLDRVRTNGLPDFQLHPEGVRENYHVIEYISPLNAGTRGALGLDLFTEEVQNEAVRRGIDSGTVSLSRPRVLYPETSQNRIAQMGALIYLPVYQSGTPPDTIEERRTTFLGMINAAIRGQELVRSIFGSQLRLFHITARDIEADTILFDDRTIQPPQEEEGWHPRFHAQMELPLYGRIWALDITGTAEYERGMFAGRSHDFSLILGLIISVLLSLGAGIFLYQREKKLNASLAIAARLREQTRQLVLANRYKSEFLANMSHELRTPLNSILILSDQLRQNVKGNLDETQTRHADIVYRAGSDLLQLINDVLDLSKIEAGRMQLSLEPLSFQDLLVDLDASMHPLAQAKGIQLYIPTITAESGLPMRVYTDRVRVHQILRNLLSNAIKFTDQGQVQLMVSTGEVGKDGRTMISFAVRDTGIGIDPALHAQVFEAFAQIDGSTRRRFGGTGLGLAITRQLVEALDGEIDVQSAPGQGSTFSVHLPMHVVQILSPTEESAPKRAGSGAPLLIVEDDGAFASVIIENAHAHGFSTIHCSNAAQALELLHGESFAAIILDILLPDISGWQLFRRLRALPAHRHTPVHIISCLPQPSGMEADQGTHYLTKPIERDILEELFVSLKQNPPSGLSLLLVEDIKIEREHYRQRLADIGFKVTACGSAQAACEVWKDGTFEVLVIDLNLPDQDGFSLLDTLDALRSLKKTRIIVNTGLDVSREGLQKLKGYSAVVVSKNGTDTAALSMAVQGFLDNVVDLPSPDSLAPQETPATLPGHRLLLVDDDIRNVYAMSALLDGFDIQVKTAGNGEEAIACYQRETPDLILMDMSMPVMDGYTATRLLKNQHGCKVPIIAMTAHAMKGDREKCLTAGCDDYIAKPIMQEELRTLLQRWLVSPEEKRDE